MNQTAPWLAGLCIMLGSVVHAQGDQQEDVKQVIEEHMRNLGPRVIGSAKFYDACDTRPDVAQNVMLPYLRDPRPAARRLAILVLSSYDRMGNLPHIVAALEEPVDSAVKAVRAVDWKKADPDLRNLARSHLRRWTEAGSVNCAESLGMVGESEDLPSLKLLLDKSLLSYPD